MNSGDASVKRLRWRCRRGMRELDLILVGYLEDHAHAMSHDDLDLFGRFLDSTDMDLYAWVTGRERPSDSALAALLDRVVEPLNKATRNATEQP